MKGEYGDWTVLGPSPDRKYYSTCQCSCGIIRDVKNSSLKLGKSVSCGHNRDKFIRKENYKESDKNIIGKRFGLLVALSRANKTGPSRYLCRCDCGNMAEVNSTALLSGDSTSCGCLRKEIATKSMEKIKELGWAKLKDGQVDGTSTHHLGQKVSKNSATGVKGVSKMKSGKYRAYISLRRKQIYLGTFDTIEDAKYARLEAEEEYFKPIIEKYKSRDQG